MYEGVQMSATVRKNFVFSEEIAMHLEEMAKENGQSMTSFVEDVIEEKYKSKRVKKRVEAFNRFLKLVEKDGKGLFTGKSIQSIKAEMDV
jgi:hypothetical protein